MPTTKQFPDYVDLARVMQQGQGNRDTIDKAMEDMYNLNGSDLPDKDETKETLSPDFRNACIAGARMLSASNPKFSIASLAPDMQEQGDEWERLADRIWQGAGFVTRKPVHFDMALSAMLYGRVNLRVKLVSDMIAVASPARKARLQSVLTRTPVLFDVPNPKGCFVLKDEVGLSAHLTRRNLTVAEIRGISAEAEAQTLGMQATDSRYVNELYDEENHAVWIEGSDKPLIMTPTEGLIPIAYADVEGSELFSGDSNLDAVQPFGYGVHKSGFWKRLNLLYTVFYTNFFIMGSAPTFVANVDQGTDIVLDNSIPGDVVKVGQGGSMGQLVKSIFTQDFQQAAQIADQKIVESTMYRTVMGESLGSGSPYSLAALLSTNGRQALIPYERMTEHACSMGMQTAFRMLKAGGSQVTWMQQGEKKQIDVKAIPDDVDVQATLAIELPVDEAKNTQQALQLTSGEHPIASLKYVREKFMDIGQSALMDKEILAERVSWMRAQAQAQAEIQQMMGQMQGAPGQVPPQGMPPQGPPQGQLPPELQAQQAQGMQDQTMGQPIPLEQIQGGQQMPPGGGM